MLGNTNPVKLGRCFLFLNDWYGFEHGGDRKSRDQSGLLNLDEIAKELNISKTGLKRALRIERNLTDSMKELRVYYVLIISCVKDFSSDLGLWGWEWENDRGWI